MKIKADEVKTMVTTSTPFSENSRLAPPGKPIPPPSKQIQNSVNTYMGKAKSTIENTVSSAKSGDMKELLSDNISTFGAKMSDVFDKAKQKVQNMKN